MLKQIFGLVKRNIILFFKDKAMFCTSLVTPLILLFLYGTFLGNTYIKTFEDALKVSNESWMIENIYKKLIERSR